MSSHIAEIAERVKGLRELCDISVEEMCEKIGVSPDDYLEYETGTKDFSFTFLYKCAHVFGVGITDIVSGESAKLTSYSVERAGEGMAVHRREGFTYLHLASRIQNRIAEPFKVTAPYIEEEQSKPIALSTHHGQEMDYILSGTLRVTIDGHIEELHAGDTIYYDSSLPHGMIAIGGTECVFLAIVMQ